MKIRFSLLTLLFSATIVCCQPDNNEQDPKPGPEPVIVDPADELNPEIKDGDEVLVTNAAIEKFLTDIHYNTHDYTSSSLRSWAEENGVKVCPGTSDRAPVFTIRWKENAGPVTVTITELPDRTRSFEVESDYYLNVYNLLPNASYTFSVKDAGGEILNQGSFTTKGKLHHLYLRSNVRNCRDLGGWRTEDGKTVKYRMVYRGGRLEKDKLIKAGRQDLVFEGIKAQLDLRGHTSSGNQEYLNKEDSPLYDLVDDFEFCAPCIEEGYAQMLNDDKEKTRQCMQFIFDCVDKGKPVYFHCSLGRDRTGTVAMLTLGILGVPEGDISQEYELTQFAPHGYATSEGESVKMVRTIDYKGAANVIWKYVNEAAGETFRDGVQKYLMEIGISEADIIKFRNNMLI